MLGIRRVGLTAIGLTAMLFGGLTACSSGDDDDFADPTGSETTSPPASEPDEAEGGGLGGALAEGIDSLSGTWEGTYECAQGTTDLTLTIDDRGEDVVAANFAYQGAASGRYSMEGSLLNDVLTLTGFRWIEQGGDYAMVGLEAPVADRGTDAIEGTVVGEGCSTFAVERTSSDPWYAGTFTGEYGCNQGMTGITLTVENAGGGEVTATYEFFAVAQNPGVPSGSFTMEGQYQDGDIALQGAEWIDQPEGYVTVDLEFWSQDGIDPQRLFGTVTGGGCSLFTLTRLEDDPAA